MKKYWAVFKTSWQEVLTYRFNFLVGRLRSIIVLLLLYYIWLALSFKTGKFAGYTSAELAAYVFGIALLRSVIMGAQTRKISAEINDGAFSKYLCMPVNYPLFVFFRELAERIIYLIFSIFEIIIFAFILKAKFILQSDPKIVALFILAILVASCLYFLLSFTVSLLSFWTREAMGPRFLFEWVLEFASGAFYPLDIIFSSLFIILKFLPFAYILFYPMMIYLGRVSSAESYKIIGLQIFWIIITGSLAALVWRKGLRKYSGEGI